MRLVTPRPGASLAWAGGLLVDMTEFGPPTSPRFAALLDATDPDIPVVRQRNPTFWNAPRPPRRDKPAAPDDGVPRPGEYAPVTPALLERVLAALEARPDCQPARA